MSESLRYKADESRQSVFAEMQAHFHASSMGRSLPRVSMADHRLDTALGGGLLCKRVHLVTSGAYASLASGFSLAVVAMMLKAKKMSGPIVWCGPWRSGQSGQLFGAGLAEIGLRPEQFIFIRESHPLRRMAACEEALATAGLGAVIHEYGPLYEKSDLWQKSARRLQLACERGSATAFMIGAAGAASGFESAWDISPVSPDTRYRNTIASNDWRAMWQCSLRHVRGGYPAQANLIWDRHKAHFVTMNSCAGDVPQSAWSAWHDQPYRMDKPALSGFDLQKSA